MSICPYCEQGNLWRVSIAGVDENAVMCDECDTVWKQDEEVVYGNGKNFKGFMAANDRETDWQAITWKLVLEN